MDPLATAADLAAYSRGQVPEGDPRVDPILDGVSAAVRRWCGWHIYPEVQETVVLDGPGGRYLALPTKQATQVQSILENGFILLDGIHYRWAFDGSVKRLDRYWVDDYRAVTVTYRHGFDEVEDVKSVVLSVASRQLASPMGAVSEAAGGVTVKWSETASGVAGGLGILAHEFALLAPYRIESV